MTTREGTMKNKIGIPPQLIGLNQWVCWGAEGEPLKRPYNPRNSYPAAAGKPDTWADFETAVYAVRDGKYKGIGFQFNSNGIVGIDIDHCIKDGTLDAWAAKWVERLDSYTEISPSGEGLHVFCIGKLPGQAIKRPEAEMYEKDRYFTVTGKVYGGAKPLRSAQTEIEELYKELRNMAKESQEKRLNSRVSHFSVVANDKYLQTGLERDGSFVSLWRGDRPNGNESADDMALLNKLAYWCSCDPEKMQAAFFESWHYNSKDEAHKRKAQRMDYLPRSIERAIQDCSRTAAEDNKAYIEQKAAQREPKGVLVASEYKNKPKQSGGVKAILARASEIPYEPPRWTIAPYFQRGKGTLIQGDNGSGKTAFICGVVAHVTTGRALLDNEVDAPGNVLMLSVEDDLPVLRGRVEASGGNLDRVFFMTNAAGMTFTSPEVETAIREINAKMVVFDPFQAFLGAGVDMFRANETRPQLAKLFEVCDRADCACVIIAHMVKSGDRSPVNKALGSVDIPAAMRSILQLVRNPDNSEECVMVHVKCSNAPKGRSIAYTIGDRGGVRWSGYSDMGVDDLAQVTKRKESGIPYEKEPLVQVFNQLITDKPGGGFWSYSDLKREGAKILGFPPFADLNELRKKLDAGLAKEIQRRDGLLVLCGIKGKGNVRGIRVERYEAPQGYQTKLLE